MLDFVCFSNFKFFMSHFNTLDELNVYQEYNYLSSRTRVCKILTTIYILDLDYGNKHTHVVNVEIFCTASSWCQHCMTHKTKKHFLQGVREKCVFISTQNAHNSAHR